MSSPGGPGHWTPHNGGHPSGGQEQPQQPGNPYSGQQLSGNPSGMEYHGFGVYEQAPPGMIAPRRKWRGPVFVGASAAVVAGLVVTIVLTSGNGDQSAKPTPPAPSTTSATSSAVTTTRETTTRETTTEKTLPPQSPVVAGWQPVGVPKRQAVYDAPKDWTLERPNNIIAFGEPDDAITMTGVASYMKGFCSGKPTSYRALTGSTARNGGSDAEVAGSTVRKLAELAYSAGGKRPEITVHPPEKVRLDQNSSTGTLVTATVHHPAPGPCDAPTSVLHVLARGNDGTSSVVHLGIAEQGVPDAFPPEALRTVSLSFRPAE